MPDYKVILKALVCVLVLLVKQGQSRLPCGGLEAKYICKEGDPSSFLICVTGYEYEFHCPPGLHFNMRVSNCDWPEKSTCDFPRVVMDPPPPNVPVARPASNDSPPDYSKYVTYRTTTTTTPRPRPRPTTTRRPRPRPRPTRRPTRRPAQRQRPRVRPRVKPKHMQLSDKEWATTATRSNRENKLTWTPSDPWAPITTTMMTSDQGTRIRYSKPDAWSPITLPPAKRTTIYDGAPTVAPTQAPWHKAADWEENKVEEKKEIPNRETPRTPQVVWREKKEREQQRHTVAPRTKKPWWERRQNKAVSRTTTTRPPRSRVHQKLPPVSGACTAEKCRLPMCRCPGSDIPGGLPMKEVPQMVMLTFDDEVSVYNFPYFRKLFTRGRNNPNGCPIKGTFFVSEVATDFSKVRELYKRGHEIASHSKSHRFPHSWWATASYEEYNDEIEGMRRVMVKKAGIAHEDIKGMRVPFLQIGGDNQYKMLQDHGYLYDSSMLTGHLFRDKRPPIWPFTLDYPIDWKYSSLEPRPKKSYRGLWEVPLIRLYGNDARACSMADSCTPTRTPQMALKYLRDNFLRHYTTNRAPLGIFIHARWFQREPYVLTAMGKFLEKLSQMDDVWLVTVSQVVEWTRNPTPISKLNNFQPFKC